MRIILGIISFTVVTLFFACSEDGDPIDMMPNDSLFDRQALLTHWADELIIPSFETYQNSLQVLSESFSTFSDAPTINSLSNLRTSWLNAYKAWQHVSIYDIGKAEELGYRNFTNIYPTDIEAINSNISSQNYNLELPSNFDAQGFPALDYLLFGDGLSDDEIVDLLSSSNRNTYVSDLISRLNELTDEVVSDWKGGYRDAFVNSSGSSATASTDKIVNDFLFYYEKFLRAGKIGIPAGVFSGNVISSAVEAPFSGTYSKDLYFEGFRAVENFFLGISHEGRNGLGLDDYLDHIRVQNNSTDIKGAILSQWSLAKDKAQNLDSNFKIQVETDNNLMLQVYDEMQKAVVLLKVDMLQALDIKVDFVDADGD